MRAATSQVAAVAAVGGALALPLIYMPEVYDFTRWPRLAVLQVITAAMFVGWLTTSVRHDHRPHPDLLLSIVTFTAWQVLSILWANNKVEALQRGSQTVAFALFALACAHTLTLDGIRKVLKATAIASGIVSVICLCQYWGVGFSSLPTAGNPSATFGYRNYLATYLVVSFPLIVLAGWIHRQHLFGSLAWGLATLNLTALICTRTRGAWVSLVFAIALLIVGGFLRGSRVHKAFLTRLRLTWGGLAILLVALVGLQSSSMIQHGEFTLDEHKTDALAAVKSTFSLSAARGRTIVWANTLKMVADAPLLGVGIGGWQFSYPAYDNGDWITANTAPQRPHNDLLWILSETGVIGLTLYFWLLFNAYRLVWVAWKENRETSGFSVAFALAVTTYVVHSLFSFPMERIASSALFWFSIGGLAAVNPRPLIQTGRRPRENLIAVAVLLILLVGGLATLQRIRFDTLYAKAVREWRRGDWYSVVQSAQSAIDIGPFDFRAYQLLAAGHQKVGHLEDAERTFKNSFAYHANEGHLPLAALLESRGKFGEAREHFQLELNLFPKSIASLYGLARSYAAMGDWQEAGKTCNLVLEVTRANLDAIESQNDRPQSYIAVMAFRTYNRDALRLLADALEKTGNLDEAGIAYEKLLGSDAVSAQLYTQYGALLSSQNKLQDALAAHRNAARMEPNDPRNHNNVGVLLSQTGGYEGAIISFKRALAIDTAYAKAYRNLGDALEKVGDNAGAINAYRSFVDHWKGAPEHRVWAEEQIRLLSGIK